jgi:hypothetical protein
MRKGRVRTVVLCVIAASVAVAATGCGGTKTITHTVTLGSKTGVGPPGQLAQFGYVKALTRKGKAYELRFDPAWLLSGITANTAAAEDGVVPPGEPVPNDHYIVDEGHRLLRYRVSPNARVTVLLRGPAGTRITVAQLAQLVAGKNPLGRKLFEPLSTGFWILVDIDTVRALDQQYRP